MAITRNVAKRGNPAAGIADECYAVCARKDSVAQSTVSWALVCCDARNPQSAPSVFALPGWPVRLYMFLCLVRWSGSWVRLSRSDEVGVLINHKTTGDLQNQDSALTLRGPGKNCRERQKMQDLSVTYGNITDFTCRRQSANFPDPVSSAPEPFVGPCSRPLRSLGPGGIRMSRLG